MPAGSLWHGPGSFKAPEFLDLAATDLFDSLGRNWFNWPSSGLEAV